MRDDDFWTIIAALNWDAAGDDDAVLEPAVARLAERSPAEILAFQDSLAAKLHALDTESHARAIGTGAYRGDGAHFSVDVFLYARCCIVANGRAFYEKVLGDPAQTPQDLDFEALLELAPQAFELNTGEPFEHTSPVDYETFSNRAGWAAA